MIAISKKNVCSILVVFAIIAFVISGLFSHNISDFEKTPPLQSLSFQVSAEDLACSEGMSDAECLQYLTDKSEGIRKKQSELQGKLSAEKNKQLTLTQQINYLNKEIALRENEIQAIEIELEAKNVEIRMMNDEINEIQGRIDTLTQETTQLYSSISKRLTISYKYNRVSPIEIFLSSKDTDNIWRRLKYLSETRKKDYALLGELKLKNENLNDEKIVLSKKQEEIQKKRDEINIQKKALSNEKSMLAGQKSTQEKLVRKSKEQQEKYENEIAQLRSLQNEIDAQATAMIMKLFSEGGLGNGVAVSQGQIIGFQGHTGCAYGSHLHFGIYDDSSEWWRANVNPYNHLGKSGAYLVNGKATAPESGAYITQGFHQGYYLDTVSMTAGNQETGACWGDEPAESHCYYVSKGSLKCNSGYSGWLPLKGEGAPIFAIYSGKVYYTIEAYGAKMALVEHDNGLISVYAHLK